MFSKLSIRTKLIALVFVLLIAPISLGAFAVYEMRAINESAQDIRTTWLPSIRQISELRVQASRYRAILRDHILIADEKKKASINKALDDRVKAYDLAVSKYDALISSPEERALFNQLGALWQDYRNAANEVIAASAKGDFAKAVEINTDKATPPGRAMDDVLFKLVDLNEKGAALSGEMAKSNYALAFRIVLGVLALMVVIGLCAAVTIVRDIARGIGSILRPMNTLATGDLSVEVPHQGEATEIGQIADAVQVFKDAMIAKAAADEAVAQEAGAKMRRAETVNSATVNSNP